MHWIAPSEKDTDDSALEERLWDAAGQFRANSGLTSHECSAPVLGPQGDIPHDGNVNLFHAPSP